MQTHANSQIAGTSIGWAFTGAHDQAKQLGARIVEWINACADSFAAAALYEELSKLSNAELDRRGVARRDLHRHVFEILSRR